MPVTDERAHATSVMREHRKKWQSHGYYHTSIVVHDKDRALLFAIAELMRWERTLSELLDKGKGERFFAGRNVAKQPSMEQMAVVYDKVAHADGSGVTKLKSLMGAGKRYAAKMSECRAIAVAEPANVKNDALYVTYSNLAAATYKYALALAEYDAPKLGEVGEVGDVAGTGDAGD